jgi:protein TonB
MVLRTVLIRKAWLKLELSMVIVDSKKNARRLPILFAIAALHAALIAVIGPLSPVKSAAARATPIEVTFAEVARTAPPQPPKIAPPLIALTPAPLLEPPDIQLADEPARTTAITVRPTDARAPVTAGRTVSIEEVRYVRAPRPRYPAESRRRAEQGLVLLLVTIDASGRVTRVDVQSSSGHPRLDAAARDAVEHALFKPYLENGIPRTVMATIPIEFNWKGRPERAGRT